MNPHVRLLVGRLVGLLVGRSGKVFWKGGGKGEFRAPIEALY